MERMENGQVETLIVKDMSRLGREYLQVGQYTEIIFPSYGVHFIAVNDGVDSNDASTCDFTPFRNLMNEFNAKDCSKKGRSVARLKAEDEVYLGHTINLKTTTRSFKDKKRIDRPESEQVRIENTHEPLIDQQTWEIVQDIRKHKRRRANMTEQNIFSGLVYCMDCGGAMVLHRAHTMDAVKNNFMCSTYKKKGKEVWSAHYIRESELAAILLDDTHRVTHFARQNENLFAQCIQKQQDKEVHKEMNILQKQIAAMQKRQEELSRLFKRLYEDRVLERIPEEQYQMLAQDYTREQNELKSRLPEAEARLQELRDTSSNITRFMENARKYTEIPELTSEILHTFIQRVEVGERLEKYSRTAPQEIRIYYRDVGLIDRLPEALREEIASKPKEHEIA